MEGCHFPLLNIVPKDASDESPVCRKDEVLLRSVLEWYNKDESRVTTFSDIVKHKNGLSLRIIDWLITNFSKNVRIEMGSKGIPADLHRDYHKNLTAHNKRNFDPFARRQRIRILLLGHETRFSTIGQLNFFRWFLSNGLCSFLLENKQEIEKHMRESEGSPKKNKSRSKSKMKDSKMEVGSKYKPQSFTGSFKLSF